MLKFREEIKIYVSTQLIDARKSIDGLCALVTEHFADNPQCGNVFIFFNKSKDKVKILWWNANGFVLYYKRLEKHRFVLPAKNLAETFEITQAQLQGLLAGLDFSLMRHFPEINYYQYA
jgi:transposase